MADLTSNQKKALAALLSSRTIADAATQCRLTERTLYKYLADPDFQIELRQRQDQLLDAAVASLAGLAGNAGETLEHVLDSNEASPQARNRAALGVLDQLRKMVTFHQLEDRVAEIEARLAGLIEQVQK